MVQIKIHDWKGQTVIITFRGKYTRRAFHDGQLAAKAWITFPDGDTFAWFVPVFTDWF